MKVYLLWVVQELVDAVLAPSPTEPLLVQRTQPILPDITSTAPSLSPAATQSTTGSTPRPFTNTPDTILPDITSTAPSLSPAGTQSSTGSIPRPYTYSPDDILSLTRTNTHSPDILSFTRINTPSRTSHLRQSPDPITPEPLPLLRPSAPQRIFPSGRKRNHGAELLEAIREDMRKRREAENRRWEHEQRLKEADMALRRDDMMQRREEENRCWDQEQRMKEADMALRRDTNKTLEMMATTLIVIARKITRFV